VNDDARRTRAAGSNPGSLCFAGQRKQGNGRYQTCQTVDAVMMMMLALACLSGTADSLSGPLAGDGDGTGHGVMDRAGR
jgi:hypothetical protein